MQTIVHRQKQASRRSVLIVMALRLTSKERNRVECPLSEDHELTTLRDWLLPMLMNGQVTVGAAEEKVGLVMAAEPAVKYGRKGK